MQENLFTAAEISGTLPQVIGPGVKWQAVVQGSTPFFYKDVCACSVWLFVTPWTVVCQAPPSMRFSRQEYWSGGHLPNPGIEIVSAALQADSLSPSHQGSPFYKGPDSKYFLLCTVCREAVNKWACRVPIDRSSVAKAGVWLNLACGLQLADLQSRAPGQPLPDLSHEK